MGQEHVHAPGLVLHRAPWHATVGAWTFTALAVVALGLAATGIALGGPRDQLDAQQRLGCVVWGLFMLYNVRTTILTATSIDGRLVEVEGLGWHRHIGPADRWVWRGPSPRFGAKPRAWQSQRFELTSSGSRKARKYSVGGPLSSFELLDETSNRIELEPTYWDGFDIG